MLQIGLDSYSPRGPLGLGPMLQKQPDSYSSPQDPLDPLDPDLMLPSFLDFFPAQVPEVLALMLQTKLDSGCLQFQDQIKAKAPADDLMLQSKLAS